MTLPEIVNLLVALVALLGSIGGFLAWYQARSATEAISGERDKDQDRRLQTAENYITHSTAAMVSVQVSLATITQRLETLTSRVDGHERILRELETAVSNLSVSTARIMAHCEAMHRPSDKEHET